MPANACCGHSAPPPPPPPPPEPLLQEILLAKWAPTVQASNHIFTWTEPYNLAFIAEHASHADAAVELGTYMGRSAKVMLDAGCRHLWSVDHFAVAGTFEVSQFFLSDYIQRGQCELIRGDSNRAAEMLVHMRGKIDFVFVDDGHASSDLIRDITAMIPLLKPGGIMCGHDFEVPHNDVANGVIQTGIPYTVPVPRMWMYVKPS